MRGALFLMLLTGCFPLVPATDHLAVQDSDPTGSALDDSDRVDSDVAAGDSDDAPPDTDPVLLDADSDGHAALPAGDDCDDQAPSVFAGAEEIPYDGIDQDCSGADLTDVDGDGYPNDLDCDDNDGAVHPATFDVVGDGRDQNCDGVDGADADGDGAASVESGGSDCDDADATRSPGAPEQWYDGVDQDCAGDSDFDQDGDGHDAPSGGGDDCDDLHADAFPGGLEVWYDGVDQDCARDSDFDQDGDGFDATAFGGQDCDDYAADMNPRDDDGDGQASCQGDCDDRDPRVHVGQTGYFSTARSDGSFDYDCSGREDRLNSRCYPGMTVSCPDWVWYSQYLPCRIPSCGQAAQKMCSTPSSSTNFSTVVQTCR